MSENWTGGCQCGAVRYAFSVHPENPCICHCRMCQQQFGNAFGAFAGADQNYFTVTRGKIAKYKSSDDALRGFCRDCGTPLTYEAQSRARVEVSIGSLDRHGEITPKFQYGIESREPWVEHINAMQATRTGESDNGVGDTLERYELIQKTNRQHPDHETINWPLSSK